MDCAKILLTNLFCMSQSYLEIAKQGKSSWWRYLLGTLLILFFWFIVGGLATVILMFATLSRRGVQSSDVQQQLEAFFKTASLETYVIANISFIFFGLGIFLAVRLLLQRKLGTLINAHASINLQRLFAGFGVWFLMQGVLIAYSLIFDYQNYVFSFNPAQWFPLLLCALILTPIQTSVEELFFRGYLLQGLGLITKNRLVLIILTSLFFMLPHLLNPEMQRGPLWLALYYFAFGVLAAVITLKDNQLELALGVHAANNLTLLFVNTKDSAIPTNAIWIAKDTDDPRLTILLFLVQSAIFYYFFFGRSKSLKTK